MAPEDLGRANALLGSAWGTMLMVGSAVGGLVATYLGRNVAFALNGLSFFVSAVLLWRIKLNFSNIRTTRHHRRRCASLFLKAVTFVKSRPR